MTAKEFDDKYESEQAVLELLREQEELEQLYGGSASNLVMQSITREASGNSLADKVEGILTQGKLLNAVPAPGPSAPTEPLCRAVVCSFADEAGEPTGVAAELLAKLREEVARRGGSEPQWVNLAKAAKEPQETLREALEGCSVALLLPEAAEDSAQVGAESKPALQALLAAAPEGLTRLFLLSRERRGGGGGGFGFDLGSIFGGQSPSGWEALSKELSSTARIRTSSRPLWTVTVRAGPSAPAPAGGAEARVLGDVDGAEELVSAGSSAEVVAEALCQAMSLDVNTDFAVAGSRPPAWPEVLQPFQGPEVWRTEVKEARRAAIFAQQWSDEFFGKGKRAARFGVKTPVEVRATPSGALLKFRPLSALDSEGFEDLEEGGLEIVAEEPKEGPPRLRVRRIAYGWKVSVREASEQALLTKFKKDWAEAEP